MKPEPNNSAARELPTTSLYLRDALDSLDGKIDWPGARTGPHSYRFDNRLVIVRYATEAEIEIARSIRARGGRVIYVIDDDLDAIIADLRLPKSYREKIRAFVDGPWRALRNHVNEIVVSSPALAETVRQNHPQTVFELDPWWKIPDSEIPINQTRPIELAWLCTRAHLADLESISEPLAEVLARHPGSRFTVLLGKDHPRWLRKLKGLENVDPLPWPDYRDWLRKQRIDVALYPLLDTPVNRARSINKFLEHGVPGAASIISNGAPFSDRLQEGDCLWAGPDEWADRLDSLISNRDFLCETANQARERARVLANQARHRQLAFWAERLPIPGLAERVQPLRSA